MNLVIVDHHSFRPNEVLLFTSILYRGDLVVRARVVGGFGSFQIRVILIGIATGSSSFLIFIGPQRLTFMMVGGVMTILNFGRGSTIIGMYCFRGPPLLLSSCCVGTVGQGRCHAVFSLQDGALRAICLDLFTFWWGGDSGYHVGCVGDGELRAGFIDVMWFWGVARRFL